MARGRKKRRKHTGALSGTAQASQQKKKDVTATLKEGGLILLAAIAAGGAGAAVGKHSLVIGLPVTLLGIYKGNKYITAAGLGFVLSNGFQRKDAPKTTEGVDGFDLKMLAEQAKDRVGTFFQNFSDKLYIPKATESAGTSGLGEGETKEDKVTYFINPHSDKDLDMSAIDRIQEEIAAMSQPVNGDFDTEREF